MTDNRILENPLPPNEAVAHVMSWLEAPGTILLEPGMEHFIILNSLFQKTKTAGRLTTDTHLAAIAIENDATICSNDNDFSRFPGLKWVNPIK